MGNEPEASLELELAYRAMISELVPLFLHELNNPLTALASLPELLHPPDWQDSLESPLHFDPAVTLQQTNEQISDLVESLSWLVRAQDQPEYSPVFPSLRALLTLMAPRLRRQRLQFAPPAESTRGAVPLGARSLSLVLFNCLQAVLNFRHHGAPQGDALAAVDLTTDTEASRQVLIFRLLLSGVPQKEGWTLEEMLQQRPVIFSESPFLSRTAVEAHIAAATDRLVRDKKLEVFWHFEAGNRMILQVVFP